MLPRLHPALVPLLLVAFPAEAARDCEESGATRELGSFLTSSSTIETGCRHNLRAPANNRLATFGQGGTCERTYRFVNGFVREVRKKVDLACTQLGDRASCAPGQSACLEAAAARFRQASATLAQAQELLAQAKAKMGEQRIQVAQVGRAYGEHLAKIGRVVELSRAPGAPRVSPLSSPRSDITGADSLRTEGLGTLREVLRASQLPEEARAVNARALAIDRAFAPDSNASPDALGPFAGEQLLAFRHAGEFAEAAARARLELSPLVAGLERNAEKARTSAERLGEDPPSSNNQKGPVKLSLNRPGGSAANASPSPASPRRPSSRSDLQLRKLAQALLPLAAEEKEGASRQEPAENPLAEASAPAQAAEKASEPVTLQKYAETFRPPERPSPRERELPAPQMPEAAKAGKLAPPEEAKTEPAPEPVKISSAEPRPEPVSSPTLADSPAREEPVPTLAPSEPVTPDLRAPIAPREYSLRDQLRARMLQAEERERSRATLASSQDPDAPPGEQDLRYDRRLSNLQPDDTAFSNEERELAEALRNLTAAYPSDLTEEISEDQGTPLFDRVREAHRRFEQRGMARGP